jgi:lysyl-tRNA synthetase class 1
VKARPETAIDFTPEGNTIPFLFNDFEKIEKVYFGLEKVDERGKNNAKRVYELTVKEIPKEKPYRIPFDFAGMLVQILPKEKRIDRVINILKRIKHIKRNLTKHEKNILENTLNYAEIWVQRFAPENMKVSLLENVNQDVLSKLTNEQKQALNELGKFLEKSRKDEEIREEIANIANKLKIKPQNIFESTYLVLLGRNFGPRLIPFIQSLDREFVVKRFKELK